MPRGGQEEDRHGNGKKKCIFHRQIKFSLALKQGIRK
jgi:hypothetical protein